MNNQTSTVGVSVKDLPARSIYFLSEQNQKTIEAIKGFFYGSFVDDQSGQVEKPTFGYGVLIRNGKEHIVPFFRSTSLNPIECRGATMTPTQSSLSCGGIIDDCIVNTNGELFRLDIKL